jgi:hypothetical protein
VRRGRLCKDVRVVRLKCRQGWAGARGVDVVPHALLLGNWHRWRFIAAQRTDRVEERKDRHLRSPMHATRATQPRETGGVCNVEGVGR